jgi:hypothetical protein
MPDQIPNFIHCSITGERLAVRRDVLLQRIKAAGSLERLQKTYVSRDARRLLKQGKTIDQIRAELGYVKEHANNNLIYHEARTSSSMAHVKIRDTSEVYAFWRSAEWAPGKPVPFTNADIIKATKDTCLRPNLKLDGRCMDCPYFQLCSLEKRIKPTARPTIKK